MRTRRRPRRGLDRWEQAARRLERLYVVDGAGPAHQGGFGYGGSGRDLRVSVRVRQVARDGDVDVETAQESVPSDLRDWRLATDWLHHALRPGELQFPIRLAADRWQQQVTLDGVACSFTFVGDDRFWCAGGDVGDRQVTISARGWPHDRLALVSVQASQVREHVPPR